MRLNSSDGLNVCDIVAFLQSRKQRLGGYLDGDRPTTLPTIVFTTVWVRSRPSRKRVLGIWRRPEQPLIGRFPNWLCRRRCRRRWSRSGADYLATSDRGSLCDSSCRVEGPAIGRSPLDRA